jgi:hypothetical protein
MLAWAAAPPCWPSPTRDVQGGCFAEIDAQVQKLVDEGEIVKLRKAALSEIRQVLDSTGEIVRASLGLALHGRLELAGALTGPCADSYASSSSSLIFRAASGPSASGGRRSTWRRRHGNAVREGPLSPSLILRQPLTLVIISLAVSKSEIYVNFREAFWESQHGSDMAMPLVVDFFPRGASRSTRNQRSPFSYLTGFPSISLAAEGEGDDDDSDDEIQLGGAVQTYKDPITLTTLVDPYTSSVAPPCAWRTGQLADDSPSWRRM